MEYAKYIIVEEMGHNVAIIFDSLIPHSDFLKLYCRACIKSAGFVYVGRGYDDDGNDITTVDNFGQSTSLDLDSKKEDERYIRKALRLDD